MNKKEVRKAKKILGTQTEGEAVDRALDLIISNDALDRAHRDFAKSGITIRDVFGKLDG